MASNPSDECVYLSAVNKIISGVSTQGFVIMLWYNGGMRSPSSTQ